MIAEWQMLVNKCKQPASRGGWGCIIKSDGSRQERPPVAVIVTAWKEQPPSVAA